MAISDELRAQILHYHFVEHWRVGTIAAQLGVHHYTVERVLSEAGVERERQSQRRASKLDPYLALITETLERFPTLTAARLFDMVKARGYPGGPDHFRHCIAQLRPRRPREAYLRLRTLPGEQSQVDWAHFGKLTIGRAERPLMAFVLVLSYSRYPFLRFYLNASLPSLIRGHVAALPRLLSLFDKAFAPRIADRFSSADEMLTSKERVMAPRGTARSEASRLEAIREAMDSEASRRQEATHQRLVEAHRNVRRVFNDVEKHVRESAGVSLTTVQHGFQDVRDTKRTLSWKRAGSEDTVLSVTFDVREAGDELVINLSGEPVYRTSLASPHYGDRFNDAIRDVLIAKLHDAVTSGN